MLPRPSKRVFSFDYFNENNERSIISFNSMFDSGNLCLVEQVTSTSYILHTAPDFDEANFQSICRSWFYFSVQGVPIGTTFTFLIKRVNMLYTLFRQAPDTYKPVYRVGDGPWKRLDRAAKLIEDTTEKSITVQFEHTFDQPISRSKSNLEEQKPKETFFAFSYPFSYKECQDMVTQYNETFSNDPDIYFHHEVFIRSPHKRRVNLLTISSHSEKLEETESHINEGLFPNREQTPRAFRFSSNKPIILFTARVHPGESPSSYAMNGLLKVLLNKEDPRGQILREMFVFLVIPMLNPDGVYHGHYRLDVFGQNLNRHYRTPEYEKQPATFAVRKLVTYLHAEKRLFFYCDLHSHASTKGSFFYGNALSTNMQIETFVFANLMSINTASFRFDQCNFSRRHMNSRDRGEKLTKEGAGRVCVYRICNIAHSYTLECGFHHYTKAETVSPPQTKTQFSFSQDSSPDMSPKNKNPFTYFTIEAYEDVGRALLKSILDICENNPSSELPNTKYGSISGLRQDIISNFARINFDAGFMRARCPSLSGSVVKLPLNDTSPIPNKEKESRKLPDVSPEKRVASMSQTHAPVQLQHKRSKDLKDLNQNLYAKVGDLLTSMVLDKNQLQDTQQIIEPEKPDKPHKLKKMITPKKIKLKKLGMDNTTEGELLMSMDEKKKSRDFLPRLWDASVNEGQKPSMYYETSQIEEPQETILLHSIPKIEVKQRGRVFTYRGAALLNEHLNLVESPKAQSELVKKEGLPVVLSKPKLKKKHLLKPLIKAISVKKSGHKKGDHSELQPLSKTAQDEFCRISIEEK